MPLLTVPVYEVNHCHGHAPGHPCDGQYGLPGFRVARDSFGTMELKFDHPTRLGAEGGYLNLSRPPKGDNFLHVEEIWVSYDLRGLGYGQRLYLAGVAEAKKRGFRGITSNPSGRNAMSNAAWKRLERTGRVRAEIRTTGAGSYARQVFERMRLRESNDCHNPAGAGGEQFCSGHAGVHEFLQRHPHYQQEVVAFAAKYGEPRLKQDVDAFWSNQRKGMAIPSMAFQLEVLQAGNARQKKERSNTRKAAAADTRAQIVAELTKRGMRVGQTVYDSDHGTQGVIKLGRDGRPYVQSALGKHPFGPRWYP